jgi:peptidoglycan/LPS O-acetylase OafA/YrhL
VDAPHPQTTGTGAPTSVAAERTDPARSGGERPERLGYQPALDGIRAVAVVLVLLFHFRATGNRPLVAGGFLGVDMFFVLSGFLITTLLLEERLGTGHISLRSFYARRALRLFPPLALAVVAAIVLVLVLDPGDPSRPEWSGVLGATFYYANWLRITSGDVLGILDHTWSLSIEEQFYLFFPPLLALVMWWRPTARAVFVSLGGLALLSFALRVWLWGQRPSAAEPTFGNFYLTLTARGLPPMPRTAWIPAWDRVYFGSETRAETLLVGALAAATLVFAPALLRRVRIWPLLGVLGALGTAIIVDRAQFGDRWVPVQGTLAIELTTVAVVLAVVLAPRAPLAVAFATAPMVWIGRRSYAIYLFHPFVFRLVDEEIVALPTWGWFVLQTAVVFVLADLSFRLVEKPAARLRARLHASVAPTANA